MKTDLENVSNLEKKLKIEVPAQKVNDEFSRAYKYLQREVNIKGFRKGKAPLETIKSIYGDKVKSDVAQNIVQATYWDALKEHKLTPVSMPSIDFTDVTEGEPFTYTAGFEIRPEVKIQKKSGFTVEKEKLDISDERINGVIDNVRQSHATYEPVKEDRAVQKGDFALIDFEGFLDGVAFPGGTAKGHLLEIGSNSFIPGFEDQIIGMKKGETKDVNVSFPADYHAEELKGKPVVFKVTVNEIQQKALPELTEEFAQKLEHKSLADFKDQVRKEIEGSEKGRIEGETRDQLLKKFVEANPVEVPKSLLDEQRKALVADFKNRLQQQGFNDSNFDEYQQKWNDDFDKTAEYMVKSAFLIDKLAEEEKLTATDKDVDAKFDEMAKQWGMEKEKIKQFYKEKQGLDRMKYQITEDNVFQYLLKNSKVDEVVKPAKTDETKA